MVLTATTFFHNYRRNRARRAEEEYNAARLLHHIGLTHLAEPHYRKVLEMPEEGQGWSLKREAAWNLAMIYTTSSNTKLARQMYEEYLTV